MPNAVPNGASITSSSRQSAGQPIVAGWSYAWLAQLSFTHDSWTAPLDVRRVPVDGDAHRTAAASSGSWSGCGRRTVPPPCASSTRATTRGPSPGVGRAGRDAGRRAGPGAGRRCFYAEPEPRASRIGRPRRHGPKFACKDERTWWAPSAEHAEAHRQYGRVRVRAWAGVHARCSIARPAATAAHLAHPARHAGAGGGRAPAAQTRLPQRLWLWRRGPGEPDLAVVWRAYVHRFDLEHTFRFCKQTLNWTTPRVQHPGQADRWTWLVLLAYTQLRLARRIAADQRLPWEAPQRPRRTALTPARVRQGFPALLAGWARRRPRQNPAGAHRAGR